MQPRTPMNSTKHFPQWRGDGVGAQALLALVRNWPLSRGKSGLLRIITRWFFRGLLPLRHCHAGRLRVDVTDYIGQQLAQVGDFEPLSLALACQLMKGGGWFVDAGCNMGLYTCVVGSLPGVRTLAIDPSPLALAQLERNLALNPAVDCIRVYTALSNESGFVQFEIPGPQNLGTGRVQATNGSGKILAYGLPATQILPEANCGPVRLLKIDIESGELAALHGWDWTASGRPRHILCEHLKDETRYALQLQEFLRSKNYQPYTVKGEPWDGCQPLPENNLWWQDENSPHDLMQE